MDTGFSAQGGVLLWLGVILLLSLAAYWVGDRLHVPRGTLLVLVGILFGPQMLDLPLDHGAEHLSLVTLMALAMVGFLLGERLYWKQLRRGTSALVIGSVATLMTALVVAVMVWLVTGDLAAALVLGAIAPATAPVATLDVLHEAGARGRLTRLLTQIVAIDDVWTVVLFTLLLVAAEISLGASVQLSQIATGLLELTGAVLLGVLLGLPMAWLTGRLSQGEPTLLEAAGFVFLAAGLASWWGFSYLLTCIVMGAVVANVAKHHVRPFRSIKGIADPFLFVFFFLAGFKLELSAFAAMGLLGVVYILSRAAGRIAGGYIGGVMAGAAPDMRRRVGPALMPQAGIAIGLAMAAVERMPELEYILPVIIASVILFEILGPSITLHQLRRAR